MQIELTRSTNAPTQFLASGGETYAYRRFGTGQGVPLVLLQHFTGTLDNWDPALTDLLARSHDLILFENAGVGRSSGAVPTTIAGMAAHALAFLDGLGLAQVDILGFSLGGMVAQQVALERPALVRRLVLAGTAPRGGEDIMHLEKPELAVHFGNPELKGYDILQKIFFTDSPAGEAAGAAFTERLMWRHADREPLSGNDVIMAQMAAFREWEATGPDDLARIVQPTLVACGTDDLMVPFRNSQWLAENLPHAVLLAWPDAGHGALFQFHEDFAAQVQAFLNA
jgi:pimeloyl-ACP methyl ester carboxylesterase